MGLRKLNEDQAAVFASLYRLNNCNAAETHREYRHDSDKLAEETHRWNGCQISNQPMVSQAIAQELKTAREIQEKVAAKHDIRFETIVNEFREGYERAMEKGALTAAMIALKELCKLFNLYDKDTVIPTVDLGIETSNVMRPPKPCLNCGYV